MRYVLFLLYCGVALSACAQSEEVHLKELRQKWSNAKTYTLALAESMPAEKYGFRPVAEEMSFGEQLVHLSSNMVWLCSDYLSGAKPPHNRKEIEGYSAKPKDEVLKIVEESLDYAAATLKNFDPKQLNEPVQFFAGPMTRRQIILLMNDHLTHHRAQAIVYLRLNGILPPKYVGW
ncbi:DinB family protein [Salmonirosea aquatica]|uniref:DUF1572 domain-containing protein n=1 Tax=Salmonirosea aquatica TaxID=2654236 RepID=A0A7C9F603_9BACT|nr:DUF1572 domain-containing protein [Cytophagaceae bacterium SJW1-29]